MENNNNNQQAITTATKKENSRTRRQKQFTKEQQHVVKKCITDAELFGLSDKETMEYIEDRTGRSISLTSLHRYKRQLINEEDDETNKFMNSYAKKKEFFDYYCKRIREMEYVQQNNLKMLNGELSKKDNERDKHLIVKLSNTIRENNNHLCQLGMSTPIIAAVRSYIDELENKTIKIQNDNYIYNNNNGNNNSIKKLKDNNTDYKIEDDYDEAIV